MTLTRENLRVMAYIIELAVFMLIIKTVVGWTASLWFMWELGMGIMGAGIVLLAVFKNPRYDKFFISIFQFGFSLFLYDLDNFVLVLFGGRLI